MSRSLHAVWDRLNGELFLRLGPERYASWIANARPVTLDEDFFLFHVESTFAAEKLERLFRETVTDAAREVTNRRVRVRFSVEPASFPLPAATLLRDETRREESPALREPTFENFVKGPGNRAALHAARAFLRPGPGGPRTLLVYAPSGLGKSHLLGALARELSRQPGFALLQLSGDQFRRHFTLAFQQGHREAFLKKCSVAHAFLFDDLHLLAGCAEAQRALADVLAALARRGSRVACASERHPHRIEGFAAPLRDLRCDLEVSIDPPDPATGAGFLGQIAPRGLPAGLVDYIARHVRSSHKDQLHCLVRVLEERGPTPASARAVVSEFLNRWSGGLTLEDIVRAVAASFGVAVRQIHSGDRSRDATEARQACYYLARRLLGHPFAQIGEHFGGRDHTTVMEACRKIEAQNGRFRDRLDRLERDLQSHVPPLGPK
jgi:chromosomal replication initiator protein